MQDHNLMPLRPQPEELPFLRQPESSISPGQTPAFSRDQSSSGGTLSGAGFALEAHHGLPQEKGSEEAFRQYKSYLQAYGLDHKKMAELDALEAFYPKGIAGFCEDLLIEYGKDVSDTKEGA